ncbi:deoxyribose-phosphate aldolase superfamily protein [Streptomyces albus]|uniref:Deoxyribose-phosphate aldolase superfamily protein n=1 Tax=Streptomyces albus (strain ATCC 21838 / DSM 41398 / FERM P-419 / JCM 4703 / NBRC 107858) TaxID=1081613 RepID=A0A0B5F1G1_STRA4|nr:deoxyribose-phosphate aldolase superfamily protein [Streptomyces albus]AOU79714.1 deoxyribose-phosphate aldolase superfamily protein [Streptomyces albus]AYN35438.1 deoxyribose-phosphate aldolase superfamily protein [Streptomyces albus]
MSAGAVPTGAEDIDVRALARIRARHPEAIAEAAARRRRRPLLADPAAAEPPRPSAPPGPAAPSAPAAPPRPSEPPAAPPRPSEPPDPGASLAPGTPTDSGGPLKPGARPDHDPGASPAPGATSRAHPADAPAPARLLIIAADHPARGMLAVGDRPMALADRGELLARLCLALSRPGVDGVLASADILDDLLLLGALEGKVVMGSMNRGGLLGARFELDDRFTGHRPEDLTRLRFDAGKLLLRLDLEDPGSLDTLHTAARTVDEMAARRLPLFVEPFLVRRQRGVLRAELSGRAIATSAAVAAGLGGTSAYTWLKMPVTEHPEEMAGALAAVTLPTVLLGGDLGDGEQDAVYERWRQALRLPTVQGLVAGRALLFPADGDVAGAVDTAVGLL